MCKPGVGRLRNVRRATAAPGHIARIIAQDVSRVWEEFVLMTNQNVSDVKNVKTETVSMTKQSVQVVKSVKMEAA